MKTFLITAYIWAIVLIGPITSLAGSQKIVVGPLETGSVVGIPFKKLPVDSELVVVDVGGKKAWYPQTIVLDPRRGQRPLLLKISNGTSVLYKFALSEDPTFTSPTALKVDIELEPSETKYIGIPASSLSYVSGGSALTIKSNDGIDGRIVFMVSNMRY